MQIVDINQVEKGGTKWLITIKMENIQKNMKRE